MAEEVRTLSERISAISERIVAMHFPQKSDRLGFSSGIHCNVDDERWPCDHFLTHGKDPILSDEEIEDDLLDHAVSRFRYGIIELKLKEEWLLELETIISATYDKPRDGNENDR